MALVAVCVYCTEENKKDDCLTVMMESLYKTVDFVGKHRLFISVNGYTERTKETLAYHDVFPYPTVIWNENNLGTAEAINLCWKHRNPGEHCLKMDEDIEVYQYGWLDDLEEIVNREPSIGQAALKRVDLQESPWNESPLYKSQLVMLPHQPGQRWLMVEHVKHCLGSCVLHSSALLDKVGFLRQPLHYGLDDVLMSARSILSGYNNVFLPNILIKHLDEGNTPYQQEKERVAGEAWEEYQRWMKGYVDGTIPLYYNPFE